MSDRPETSTARVALDVAGAALDLLQGSPTGSPRPDEASVRLIEQVIRGARDLRPYQVDDVLGFVRDRAGIQVKGVASDVPDREPEGDE